jgi:hypothetical protein
MQGCLWSSNVRIGTKATLCEHYEHLEPFFVEFLGVDTLTLSIVHDELIRLGSSKDASVSDTRDLIINLNSFLVETDPADYPSASKLAKANILPIRDGQGTIGLGSSESVFVIIDRTYLEKFFADEVETLCFSFAEVCQLEPFVEFLGIKGKRLSELFEERTELYDDYGPPFLLPQRQIGPKAHALYR